MPVSPLVFNIIVENKSVAIAIPETGLLLLPTKPTILEETVAKKNPNKRIILAHTGSTRLLECCAFTRKIPNIFYDLSFVSTYFNHTSVRIDMINYLKYTSDRMMFGSDYPSFNIAGAKQALIEICEEAMLGEKQIDNVFSKTASKVYSIEENHL